MFPCLQQNYIEFCVSDSYWKSINEISLALVELR